MRQRPSSGIGRLTVEVPRLHIVKTHFCAWIIMKEWRALFRDSYLLNGPGSSVGITTALRAGRSGNRIPVGGEIFRPCPDRHWHPPSLLCNGYWVFPGGKKRSGRDADPSPLLVPWSWKGRGIPLLPLWAVRPVQSLSACTRVTFTLPQCLYKGALYVLLYLLNTQKTHGTNIRALSRIRTHHPSTRRAVDLRLRPHGHRHL